MEKMNKFLKIAFVAEIVLILFLIYTIGKFLLLTSPADIANVVRKTYVWQAIWITLSSATISTFLGLLLGVPTGYFIARKNNSFTSLVENIMVLPTLIPHVIVGIIILVAFGGGTMGNFLTSLGIAIVDSFIGIVIVIFFVSFPYIVTASATAFRSYPISLEEVSYSLGIGEIETFFRISLPLAIPSILRGGILSFARAMSETGALLIVATYPRTAQVLILSKFETEGIREAQAISFVVIILSFLLFALFLSLKFSRWDKNG